MVENTQAVGPQQPSRPKPLGHADLNVHWVGAGHVLELRRHLSGQFRLEKGDKIRTVDGSSGTVLAVVNVVQARVMFNLEVAGNHDFFVGEGEWLVHNASKPNTPIPYDYYTDRQVYVEQIAKKYGINLRQIKVIYDENLLQEGMTYEREGGKIIRVGRSSFNSGSSLLEMEANVADTIAHETVHARNYLRGHGKLGSLGPIADEEHAIASGQKLRNYILGGC